MTIDAILDDVLRREGGFVDHPDDSGGVTSFGITRATLGRWRGRPVSGEEAAAPGIAEARASLAAACVRGPGIDRFSPALQPFRVDATVHHGPGRVIQFLQPKLEMFLRGWLGPVNVFDPVRGGQG